MTTGLEHKSEFISDTENILERLSRLLTSDELVINKIYREVHSLKGAAGFAGLDNMEHLAHSLENLLTSIKNGEVSLNSDTEQILFKSLDYFIKDIQLWKTNSEEVELPELISLINENREDSLPLSIEVVTDKDSHDNFFSDFEKTLLKEAMYRGEQFYRIICHIDRDEEMKYPRLFLVVNNLEKITNVIRTDPPMADVSKNKNKEITLYLTTGKSKVQIYKSLNFDRVSEVEVLRLDYSSFFSKSIDSSRVAETSLYGNKIEVETNKIEEIFNYSQDLYNKLLLEDLVKPEKKNIVKELLLELKNSLTTLTTISIEEAFSSFTAYCEKLGSDLGKDVEFSIVGGDIFIERELAEVLKELFIQLVKNSAHHGIETRDERISLNKNPKGNITLKVSSVNDSLAITILDDGRGVDQREIVKQGVSENYIDKNEEISLLSLLSRPGFSTSKDINYYSGRGIGLDLVVNRVINKLDGKIRLENSPGKGLAFHILIPPSTSVKKFTLFKYRNHSFGFSLVNVIEKISISDDSIILGENKTLNYKYNGVLYPIYTPWGRLSSSSAKLGEKYGFIIRYLGKKAFFPVDEFVLEKEYLSSGLKFLDTDTPSHKRIRSRDKMENFTLILPSIING